MTPVLESVLGHPASAREVAEFLSSLNQLGEVQPRQGETALDFPEAGVSVLLDANQLVIAIQLYSAGRDGFAEFRQALPAGLMFKMVRSEVRRLLGEPSRAGGGGTSILYDRVPDWDRYDYRDWSLHIEYAPETQTVSLVSLMTPESTPGR